MIKKMIIGILGVVTLYVVAVMVQFGYIAFRSVWPAFSPPAGDIAKDIRNPFKNPLVLPPEFSVSVFADGLGNPRDLSYDPAGNIIVSVPNEGKVLALTDKNGDGIAEKTVVIRGLRNPHGLATRCASYGCSLYIAEEHRVGEYAYDNQALRAVYKRSILNLPSRSGDRHTTRSLLFLPVPNDRTLLVSVGSSCDVCREEDERYASVLAVNVETHEGKIYARGLRNAVFLALHPVTGQVWGTEMGRDNLGDDLPPDEINVVEEERDYGWPICFGKNIHDGDFDKNEYVRDPCADAVPAHIEIPAHSAPLGLAFVPEEGWLDDWQHNLIVAYHGSWNRTTPTGYKLVRYKLDASGTFLGVEDFMTGWLADAGALGRPVDILIQPGGVMYVSDDKAGVVYRIVRQPIPRTLNR